MMTSIKTIIPIILAMTLLPLISSQCDFTDCFNCTSIEKVYAQCAWINNQCQSDRSNYNYHFYLRYDNCTSTDDVIFQNTYCGNRIYYYSDSIDVFLPQVDGLYGVKNVFCNYTIINDNNYKTITINLVKQRGIIGVQLAIGRRTYNNRIDYQEIRESDYHADIESGREVIIAYTANTGYNIRPFKISMYVDSNGVSLSMILSITLTVMTIFIFIVILYVVTKRIRQRKMVQRQMMANQANVIANANVQAYAYVNPNVNPSNVNLNPNNANVNVNVNGNANANLYPSVVNPVAQSNLNLQVSSIIVVPQQGGQNADMQRSQLDIIINNAMKQMKYKEELGKYNLNCTICLEEFDKTSNVGLTSCNHLFHYTCLRNWLMKNMMNSKCPNCNNPLAPELAKIGMLPVQQIQVGQGNNNQNGNMIVGGPIGYNSINANNINNENH